jgi:hypothetical protein
VWAVLRRRPQHAPGALALAAVGKYGEAARTQAEWLRRTYPDIEPDRLARVAIRSAERRARFAALITGLPLGGLAALSGELWAQARLVLDVAAIYGLDPTDPARAAEILALLGVYPDVRAARASIRDMNGESAGDGRKPPGLPRFGEATVTLARSAAARAVPGSAIVLASLGAPAAAADLGARAVRFYRERVTDGG